MPLGSLTGSQSSVMLLRHDCAPLGETRCGAGGGVLSSGGTGVATLTTAWRVTELLPHRAVRTYVVVVEGETLLEPGVPTPPIPGLIDTESALVTAPQLRVEDCPG